MDRQQRLTRPQVIARLRANAAARGFVSFATLDPDDKLVLRSIPLYFPGLAAAREAAGVLGPPHKKGGRKTGPKPGTPSPQRRVRTWSWRRVLDELRALHRARKSTRLEELLTLGKASLVAAARMFAGGLRRARKAAGIPPEPRKASPPLGWTRERLVRAIARRSRAGESLASTRVPQALYGAARRTFGSWAKALSAAGVDPIDGRAHTKYTHDVIVEKLRDAAARGSDLRYEQVRRIVDMKAIHREFGTLVAAIRAAGLHGVLERRKHRGTKWDRARVLDELRVRAARGVYTMNPGLRRAAQLYAGGSYEARLAAGTLRPARTRPPRRYRTEPQPRSWTRQRLIDTLRERAAMGKHTLTSSLYRAARAQFGSTQSARVAAGVPEPIDLRAAVRKRQLRAFQKRHAGAARRRRGSVREASHC